MTPIEVLFAAAFMATTFTIIVNVIISVYSDEKKEE
jgi:hypothetical protein